MKNALQLCACLLIASASGTFAAMPPEVSPTGFRAAYSKNLRIHIGRLGVSDGEPLTAGDDFKPVWSKSGDQILFFRRLVNHREVGQWKTAVFHMDVDGGGQHQLTSGAFTDFNHTWSRDGRNTPIWNRKKPKGGGYTVFAGRLGGEPGEEHPLTDPGHHAWAFTCLTDGRIFVAARREGAGLGYYLMTPAPDGTAAPTYERVAVPLARTGVLDRVSISPNETRICFEFQPGFKPKVPGRTLYVGDFDPQKLAISKLRPFANPKGEPVWFAYPRWTPDGSAIMYHAGGALYLYTLEDGVTRKVSIDAEADYRYPHGEATPK